MNKISRKGFIKIAAAAAMSGVTAGALAACNSASGSASHVNPPLAVNFSVKSNMKTEGKTRAFMQECFENIVVIKTFISEVPFINKLDSYMDKNFRLKIKLTSKTDLT